MHTTVQSFHGENFFLKKRGSDIQMDNNMNRSKVGQCGWWQNQYFCDWLIADPAAAADCTSVYQ